LFYTTLELKPEKLASSTSEIFLGIQIQCAQCHDHPFDKWKQKDFWGYAAFFARLQRPTGQQRVAFQVVEGTAGEVKLPDSDEVVPPKFLDGKELPADSGIARRVQLADWMTSPDNPYFARAAVNHAWSLLFGYGLVDPVDRAILDRDPHERRHDALRHRAHIGERIHGPPTVVAFVRQPTPAHDHEAS
ncbi:MAG: DUF1549 domain-containing protein, partial [Gemmatimonadetes bacterium]|nr:DUF1549 domain-containing protein [Gemmatimonadota bacterium]